MKNKNIAMHFMTRETSCSLVERKTGIDHRNGVLVLLYLLRQVISQRDEIPLKYSFKILTNLGRWLRLGRRLPLIFGQQGVKGNQRIFELVLHAYAFEHEQFLIL